MRVFKMEKSAGCHLHQKIKVKMINNKKNQIHIMQFNINEDTVMHLWFSCQSCMAQIESRANIRQIQIKVIISNDKIWSLKEPNWW